MTANKTQTISGIGGASNSAPQIEAIFERNLQAFLAFAREKGAEVKSYGAVYFSYHELTPRIQKVIERAGGRAEPVDPQDIWRELIFEHFVKPLRLGPVQREYLHVVKASGGEAVAWKLFECLHYNAYPYYYFMRRLSALSEKGLIQFFRGGKLGGLAVRLTREGVEVALATARAH